jgi:hypothetical protein
MKKILILLTLILTTLCSFGQTYTNYTIAAIDTTNNLIPRYLLGENVNTNTKDTIGIVITIKQALKINTDLDILQLYRGLHKECDSTVNFLVQVVDDYKKVNVLAESRIEMTDSLLKNSNQQVLNLKDQLNISAQRILAKDSVIKAKDDLMVLEKDQTSCRIKKRNRWIEGLGLFLLYMLIGHPGIK